MAKINRATFKSTFNDFIDRVAPFDGDPLIQKSEHKQVISDDLGDSVVFSEATESSINSPSAAFSVDFDTVDQYTIDTTGVGTTAFTITLQNLDENRTGLLVMNKKSNDTFTFANGELISILGLTQDQEGQTEIKFVVRKFAGVGTFVVYPSTDLVPAWTSLGTSADVPTSTAFYRRFNDRIEFKGNVTLGSVTSGQWAWVTLPSGFRPPAFIDLICGGFSNLDNSVILTIEPDAGATPGLMTFSTKDEGGNEFASRITLDQVVFYLT